MGANFRVIGAFFNKGLHPLALDKLEFDKLSRLLQFFVNGLNTTPYQINGNNH